VFILILKENSSVLLSEIDSNYASNLYFVEFKYIHEEKQNSLDIDDFIHGIKVLNAVVDINKEIDGFFAHIKDNPEANLNTTDKLTDTYATNIYAKLKNPSAHLQDINGEHLKKRYLNSFYACKRLKINNNSNSSYNNTILNECKNLSLCDSGHVESDLFSCSLLTHGEIQECISQTNSDYEQECLGKYTHNTTVVYNFAFWSLIPC
jgi:hypothetical protein